MYEINKCKLLKGDGFQINKWLTVKQPKINEIIELDDKYNKYCLYFITNTEDFMVQLYDLGIKYYEISMYDIFLKQFESEQLLIEKGENFSKDYVFMSSILNWWFNGNYNFELVIRNEIPILLESSSSIVLDLYGFEKMTYFIKLINCQRLENKFTKPGKQLFDMLIKKKKRKLEREKKQKLQKHDILHDLILSLSSISKTINIFNVWDLGIYQFYSLFRKTQRIRDVNNLNLGIYTGNIDTKKNRINTDWIKDEIYKEEIIGYV